MLLPWRFPRRGEGFTRESRGDRLRLKQDGKYRKAPETPNLA